MQATAMAAVGLMLIASGALAQDTPAPSLSPPPATEGRSPNEGASATPQAPIGHRQPTLRDLPPDVARRQQSEEPTDRSTARGNIDPELRICRGC